MTVVEPIEVMTRKDAQRLILGIDRPRPMVYLAGPIDSDPAKGTLHMGGWRHADWQAGLAIKWFCPNCENVGSTDYQIMERNENAWHYRADRMVAFWTDRIASFGTPIEIWKYTELVGPAFVVCHGQPGVFLRDLVRQNRVILGESFVEAREWLTASLRL